MANRPIFLPIPSRTSFVRKVNVEFTWYPGMSASQKQKSIASLHEAGKTKGLASCPLEISSKSEVPLGKELSAFNLSFHQDDWSIGCVETAFQGSKVFEFGGPFTDLYSSTARAAKKDERLRSSGKLVAFSFMGAEWPLQPLTLFYDWLYLNALHQNPDLAGALPEFDAFTDIEFNPKRSINCQAYSAALYVSLKREGMLDELLRDQSMYRHVIEGRVGQKERQQGLQF